MPKTDRLKKTWWRMPKPIRQTLVLMVGLSIIAAGLFMLIFPGPGWAAIFLGFAVLASEFAAAARVRDWMIQFLRNLFITTQACIKRLINKH